MKQQKVALFLITRDNDFQREQASVAEATAQRLGLGLRVSYAGSDPVVQMTQVLGAIRAAPEDRPDVVVVETVGTGMAHAAAAAAENGIGWVVLNKRAETLASLPGASRVPFGSVEADNLEVGRIQARQFSALLPSGGTVLYMEGPPSDVARLRRAGLDEARPPNLEIKSLRGSWTEESASRAIRSRLQLAAIPSAGIVGCQNDAMAMGIRKAVESLTDVGRRQQWLALPFTGVDGVPTGGKASVQSGTLTATVVIPPLSGVALELVARALATGAPMPERTLLKPVSFPPIEDLRTRRPAPVRHLTLI